MKASLIAASLFLTFLAGCDFTSPAPEATDEATASEHLDDGTGFRAPLYSLPPDSVKGGGL